METRHGQELTMGRPVVRQAPSWNDQMAHGQANGLPDPPMLTRSGRQREPAETPSIINLVRARKFFKDALDLFLESPSSAR